MSDLLINVRQIANYPALTGADGSETLLVQRFGLGGPYASISAKLLASTALNQAGPLGVGRSFPVDADGSQIFTNQLCLPADGDVLFNAYYDRQSLLRFWQPGGAAALRWDAAQGLGFYLGPSGPGGSQVGPLTPLLTLGPAGNLTLPRGTLRVARDPAAADEVATLRWVTGNTVASLNGRRGAVTLSAEDVYRALAPDSPLATEKTISDRLQEFAAGYPLVTAWNGRVGSVWLQLADVMSTFFEPGARPIAPTPPPTDASARIATTEWVANFAYQKLWIDILGTFAPLNSPVFTGNPTAPDPPLDSADQQLATTEWVRSLLEHIGAGVLTWNGRSGYVTLTLADITGAQGAPINSPAFTGTPTTPTPPATAIDSEVVNARWVNENAVKSFNTRQGVVVLTLADILGATGQRNTHVAATAPTADATGDFWYEPASRRLSVWDGSAWVRAGAPGVEVGDTPPANAWQGDQWYNSAEGQMYLWYESASGAQWVAT